jgi:hypothetical protein
MTIRKERALTFCSLRHGLQIFSPSRLVSGNKDVRTHCHKLLTKEANVEITVKITHTERKVQSSACCLFILFFFFAWLILLP